MGISKLPVDMSPERWELIFYIVRITCYILQNEKKITRDSLEGQPASGPS